MGLHKRTVPNTLLCHLSDAVWFQLFLGNHLKTTLLLGLLAFTLSLPLSAHAQSAVTPPVDAVLRLNHALEASRQWIAAFNTGDANACANLYTPDAVMTAQPFGTFRGRDAIRAFWSDLIAKGARDLRYSRIKVDQTDDNTVLISADWTMNIGGGVITRERWVQIDGRWLLAEDQFEVRSQNK